jgi:dienelactone hydrolase
MMLKTFFLIPFLVCTVSFGQTDFLDPQFGINVTSDIVYATGAVQSPSVGDKNLLLDLYEPTGAGVPASKPGFVIIHGGGFTGGDKGTANFVGLATEYTQRGYVCISINYRLVGDDPPTPGATAVERAINAAVEDAANAVAWIKANASAYGIDPTRIAIGGNSAGAITSLFEGYRELGSTAKVQAVVSFAGGLYGFESLIDALDPPVILFHGDNDTTVPYSLAGDIDDAAAAAGIAHEFYTLIGVGHGAMGQRNSYILPGGDTSNEKLQAFLYQHLQLATIASPYLPNPAAMPVGTTTTMVLLIIALAMIGNRHFHRRFPLKK